jgi:type IV pilus assembly protein PilX
MNKHRHQGGTALITSLLLLLVLTVIGITAMQVTRMQERMAGNTRDLNLSFQGAEAALRNGEDLIAKQAFAPEPCATAPCDFWAPNATAVANAETRPWETWWNTTATTPYEANGDHAHPTHEMTDLEADPRFVIEFVAEISDPATLGDATNTSSRYFYQVTAASPGATPNAVTVLQSTYARR